MARRKGDAPRWGWRDLLQALRAIRLRPYDYVILVISALVIVAFSTLALGQGGAAALVEIRSDAGDFVYALNEDREVVFEGPLGDTVVRIEANTVRFTESPCRDKICIAAGALSEAGQWAACLPNRVFITVTGGEPDERGVDGATF